jgi:flagellar biosynthesis chaperone FliJ
MPFKYRLEALLRLQRSLEHQEENRLLACVARVAQLKAHLQFWEHARFARKQRTVEELQEGARGIVLQLAAEWDAGARRKQAEIRKQIEAAERLRLQQLQVYREARQKREVLDDLRQRQQTTHDQEEFRRLQRTLDESFLIQTFHKINS